LEPTDFHVRFAPVDFVGFAVEAEAEINCIAIASALILVLVHAVVKWLHHPLAKYVMLLHAGSS